MSNHRQTAINNMIEQQLRVWNVLDQKTLDLFLTINREDFTPKEYLNFAFCDSSIPLNQTQYMLEPKVQAHIVQSLKPQPKERALIIGSGTGFMVALLASICQSVCAYEIDPALFEDGKNNLEPYGFSNTELFLKDASTVDSFGSFDCIALCGAIDSCPKELKQSLTENGRLFYLQQKQKIVDGNLITKVSEDYFNEQLIIQTFTSDLVNFDHLKPFVF